MRKLFALAIILLSLLFFAEANANTCNIKGCVVDTLSNIGLSYATVRLYSEIDNKLVSGVYTDSVGNFNIEKVAYNRYYLKISYMGYKTKQTNSIFLNSNNLNLNLDTIKLCLYTTDVKGVEIVGKKQAIEFKFEKKIVNVSMMQMINGKMIIDVLKNSPFISVMQKNADYTVLLNGNANITYFFDGRPTSIDPNIIFQMPAEDIDRIEITTNPTAKYDAEGVAGIIDFIKRKDIKMETDQFSGRASLNVGSRDNYSASVKFNYQKAAVNYNINYNCNLPFFNGQGEGYNITKQNQVDQLMLASADYTNKGYSHNFDFMADYLIDSVNSVLFSLSYNKGNRKTIDDEYYNKYNSMQPIDLLLQQDYKLDNKKDGNNLDLSVNYKKRFSEAGKELGADLYYTNAYNDDLNDAAIIDRVSVDGFRTVLNKYSTESKTHFFMAKSDMTLPIDQFSIVECGIKGLYRNRNLDYRNEYFNQKENSWKDSLNLSNGFLLEQYIFALYATYAKKIGELNLKVGLRTEYTNQILTQNTLNLETKDNYPDFFPSVNIGFGLTNEIPLNLSYSRRIVRPDITQLNPFTQIRNSFFILDGNANLKPEYIDSYSIEPGLFGTYVSLYYRNTKNHIMSVSEVTINNVEHRTYQNVGKKTEYGISIYRSFQISQLGQVTLSGGYSKKKIEGNYSGQNLYTSESNWYTNFFTSINLGWGAGVYFSMYYWSPSQDGQNYSKGVFGSNAGLNKNVFNNRGNISLNISDPFGPVLYKNEVKMNDYYFRREFKSSFTMVALSFTYSFDNFKEITKKWLDENTGSKEYEKR